MNFYATTVAFFLLACVFHAGHAQQPIEDFRRLGVEVQTRENEVVAVRLLPDKETFVRKALKYRDVGQIIEGIGVLKLTGRRRFSNGQGATDAELRLITDFPRVQSLSIAYTEIGDPGLRHIQQAEELTDLVVDRTRVTDEGISFITHIPKLKRLSCRDLELTNNSLQKLAACVTLESLTLSGTQITDTGLQDLARLVLDQARPNTLLR